MYKEEELMATLKKDRYGIKDLANWLGLKYPSTYAKVKGKNAWNLTDLENIKEHIGLEATINIFLK